MQTPSCPVEFALWWCQRYHRIKACAWAPEVEHVELFKTICQLRAESWSNQLEHSRASKRKLLGILNSPILNDSRASIRQQVIRNVLVCEPLVRVLASVSRSIRSEEIRQQIHPLLHESFISTRQARCVALEHLLEELDRGLVWARSLNRLRITIEQWTDLLLGMAAASQNISLAATESYGFQPERIREFAFETRESNRQLSGMLEDWFLLQGIRRTMRSFGLHPSSHNKEPMHSDWDLQLHRLAAGFLGPKSFRVACLTQSLQIDQRFEALEGWFAMLGDGKPQGAASIRRID